MNTKEFGCLPVRGLAMLTLVAVALGMGGNARAADHGAQVDVALWFDTEDFLLPASDDAAKRLAELLGERGIRATFRVVGEKARVLEQRGRRDVIDALSKHDIGYHTNLHSVHPTPAEYLSECGLLDGVAEFVRREKQGAADVRRVFGRPTLTCYCQPGASWASQAIVALEEIGVGPVCADIGTHIGLHDRPFWCAGVLNIYEMGDNYTDMALYDRAALEPAKAKVSQIVERLRSEGGGLINIGYHPCDWVHQQFWDAVNFRYGANPPREQWKVPPQRPAAETEQAFAQFAAYIDHIRSLGVRFVTAGDLPSIYADRVRTEGLSEAELLELARNLADPGTAGVDHQIIGGKSVSPADQFELLVRVACDAIEGKGTEFPLVAGGILGPDSPPGPHAQGGRTVAWAAFRDAVLDVRAYLRATRRVPPRVFVGADCVSPADFLRGTAAAWCYRAEQGSLPPDTVTLGDGLSVLTERHVAAKPVTPFTWSIHKRDLDNAGILAVARLQAWTLKPALRR